MNVRKTLRPAGRYLLIALILFIAMLPIFWMASTSIKPRPEWAAQPIVWIPNQPTSENYEAILLSRPGWMGETLGMLLPSAQKPIFDSLLISGTSTALALIVGTLAAYGASRFRAGGRMFPFFVLLFRMFPPVTIIIPIIIMYSTLGLVDTYYGLILAYTAITLPFVVWLMKSFFDEIPKEIDEAAILDGRSFVGAFFRNILPLARAGMAVTGLFVFILDWSDFPLALLLTRTEIVTIPVQLARYTSVHGQLYGPMAALGTIALIPVFVFGLLIQRYIIRGLTFGALKG